MRFSSQYITYACTIFLSAFLVFVIQPIAGKHLLPAFGGSSSVWATSLLFFTSMLFAGYLYVYLLTKHGGKRQVYIHLSILGVSALLSLVLMSVWHAVFPSLEWTIGNTGSPAWNVLIALFVMIGAPYFLLSTTGPLLQYWYGLSSHSEPYKLYALSNGGSLLALVGYIFIIEPFVPLHIEENVWVVLFFIYLVILISVCRLFLKTAQAVNVRAVVTPDEKISLKRAFAWIGLAALPSLLLLATTTTITQTVAPVPLLWVVPLTIYLVTLILAFAGIGQSKFVPLFVLVSAYFAYIYQNEGSYYVVRDMSSALVFLFIVGIFCHGQLYRLRPGISRLPLFYLFLSFGGMLGILCASIIAPLIFTDYWEFPLSMAVAAVVAGLALSEEFFPRIFEARNIALTKILFGIIALALVTNYILVDTGAPFAASRNFYGAVKVRFKDEMNVLMHGTTIHGFQPKAHAFEYLPNSYYTAGSGLGRAMLYEQSLHKGIEKKTNLRIGILGLGTGAIAAYCRPGDTFVYYEIDPRIVRIARSDFSYLQHCRGSEVRMGDGRLRLEQELRDGLKGSYDLVVADAFTDDTIPVHLVTLQAVAVYAAHLRSPQSIIAIHTSNRHLDLPPVILKIAMRLGFSAKLVQDSGESSEIGTPSQWVLLAKDPKVFTDPAFANSPFVLPDVKNAPLWTDDYTSLLSVLR